MASMSIKDMRDWLKNCDPLYGGHIGWINKVNSYSDGQIIAVYRSRQEAIAKESARRKVEEDAKKGLPTIMEDVSNQSKRENWHQMTLMEVFGQSIRETNIANCVRF